MHLLDHLPKAAILAAYEKSPGRELDGKSDSPESSAALVANAFGYFVDRPAELPPLPGLASVSRPPSKVQLEANVRFPWAGGTHPWLDVLIDSDTHTVGVESKRYEPYRGRHDPAFSDAYARDVWSESMSPYLRVMEALKSGTLDLHALDATQLVKHALALSTQCLKSGRRPVLYYLFADPDHWPDGRPVPPAARALHAEHLAVFAHQVAGAHVEFAWSTYPQVLASWAGTSPSLTAHVEAVRERFLEFTQG
jgi:hypothetical protein